MATELKWFTGRTEENFGLSMVSDTAAYSGHLDKAREATRRSVDSAIRADSKETGAIWHENAALYEAAFGDFAQAKQAAADGLKLAPASQPVSVEAALAYAMAGDKEKARSAYADFLALWKSADPDIPVLKLAEAEQLGLGCCALH